MVSMDEDEAAIRFLRVKKHYGAERVWKEFPTKNWLLED